jgi:hypothetical protein
MCGFFGEIQKRLIRIISKQRQGRTSNAQVGDVAGLKPVLSALKTDTAKRDKLDEDH